MKHGLGSYELGGGVGRGETRGDEESSPARDDEAGRDEGRRVGGGAGCDNVTSSSDRTASSGSLGGATSPACSGACSRTVSTAGVEASTSTRVSGGGVVGGRSGADAQLTATRTLIA